MITFQELTNQSCELKNAADKMTETQATLYSLDLIKSTTDVLVKHQEEFAIAILQKELNKIQVNTKFDLKHMLLNATKKRILRYDGSLPLDRIIAPLEALEKELECTLKFLRYESVSTVIRDMDRSGTLALAIKNGEDHYKIGLQSSYTEHESMSLFALLNHFNLDHSLQDCKEIFESHTIPDSLKSAVSLRALKYELKISLKPDVAEFIREKMDEFTEAQHEVDRASRKCIEKIESV